MKRWISCQNKKILLSAAENHFSKNQQTYLSQFSKIQSINYLYIFHGLLSQLKKDEWSKKELLIPSVNFLIDQNLLISKLNEDLVLKFFTFFPNLDRFQNQSDLEIQKATAFLEIFKNFCSENVRNMIIKGIDYSSQDAMANLSNESIDSFVSLMDLPKSRHLSFKKSKFLKNAININDSNRTLNFDLYSYNPKNIHGLNKLKKDVLEVQKNYEHVFFTDWNYMLDNFSEVAENVKKPIFSKNELSNILIGNENIDPFFAALKNYSSLDIDYTQALVQKKGKVIYSLSTILFLCSFAEKFKCSIISPPKSDFLIHLARNTSIQIINELIDQLKSTNFLRMFYFLNEIECQHSKHFFCKGSEISSSEELINDFSINEQFLKPKFNSTLQEIFKTMRKGKQKPSEKATALILVDNFNFGKFLRAVCEFDAPISQQFSLNSGTFDSDLKYKIAALHAIYNFEVDSSNLELQKLGIEDIQKMIIEVEKTLVCRELIGTQFSTGELSRCYNLRTILKPSNN